MSKFMHIYFLIILIYFFFSIFFGGDLFIISRLVWNQGCGSCSRYRLGDLALRSGGSLQEETEQEMQNESRLVAPDGQAAQ